MSIGILLAFAATSVLVLLLPSASGTLLRDYGLTKGRRHAALLILPIVLGYLVSGLLAFGLYFGIHDLAPAMEWSLAWLGLFVIAIYVLRSRHRRQVFRLADNDNLPAQGVARLTARALASAVRPGLILALAGIFFQMSASFGPMPDSLLVTAQAFAAAALVAPIVQLLIAEPAARKIRLTRQQNPALRKPRRRFIASRAVTAGYRRIAA